MNSSKAMTVLFALALAQLLVPCAASRHDPLSVQIEETKTSFTIGWQGQYPIDRMAFVYAEKDSGRIRTILGYPPS